VVYDNAGVKALEVRTTTINTVFSVNHSLPSAISISPSAFQIDGTSTLFAGGILILSYRQYIRHVFHEGLGT
jgi:hypothetical protein